MPNPKETLTASAQHARDDLHRFLASWAKEGKPPARTVAGKPVDGLFWLTHRLPAARLVRRQAALAGVPVRLLEALDREIARGDEKLAGLGAAMRRLKG